jgi:hypothetical protein
VDVWANDKTGTILTEATTNRTRFRGASGAYDWKTAPNLVNTTSAGKRETTTTSDNIPEYYALAYIMKE